MIQIGDLVKGAESGRIGIVIRPDPVNPNYYYVQFHDATATIHAKFLIPLETK